MRQKKILVLGGTGAMGVYLVPELLKMGYQVQVVSMDDCISNDPNLVYTKVSDAKDPAYLAELLQTHYDGIVDFMIYRTEEFRARHQILLGNTDHYIYLSSYRIYGPEYPITEQSPRLLECSTDAAFLATEDYGLYKARGEDILSASGFDNWTAIRPAITYSKRRFQLVTMEAQVHVHRARLGKTVLVPEPALEIEATMSWAGDVAKMIARLLFNPRAYKEKFTVSTAEHNTWGAIAQMYREIYGLEILPVDTETYLHMMSGDEINPHIRWQLEYDRYFTRIVDNSKILDVAQMKQSELMPLREGLSRELTALPKDYVWPYTGVNDRMDAYLANL